MKKIICYILFGLMSLSANAQTDSSLVSVANDTIRQEELLKKLVKEKYRFYFHRVSKLYDILKKADFPIKYIGSIDAEGWGQPDGKGYVVGIILFNKTFDEIMAGAEVLSLRIPLAMKIEYSEFWNSFPDTEGIEEILEGVEGYGVKFISYRKERPFPRKK